MSQTSEWLDRLAVLNSQGKPAVFAELCERCERPIGPWSGACECGSERRYTDQELVRLHGIDAELDWTGLGWNPG